MHVFFLSATREPRVSWTDDRPSPSLVPSIAMSLRTLQSSPFLLVAILSVAGCSGSSDDETTPADDVSDTDSSGVDVIDDVGLDTAPGDVVEPDAAIPDADVAPDDVDTDVPPVPDADTTPAPDTEDDAIDTIETDVDEGDADVEPSPDVEEDVVLDVAPDGDPSCPESSYVATDGSCVPCDAEPADALDWFDLAASPGYDDETRTLELALRPEAGRVEGARIGWMRIDFTSNQYFATVEAADAEVVDGRVFVDLSALISDEFEGFELHWIEIDTACGASRRTRRINISTPLGFETPAPSELPCFELDLGGEVPASSGGFASEPRYAFRAFDDREGPYCEVFRTSGLIVRWQAPADGRYAISNGPTPNFSGSWQLFRGACDAPVEACGSFTRATDGDDPVFFATAGELIFFVLQQPFSSLFEYGIEITEIVDESPI